MNKDSFPPEVWYAHRVSYGETDAMNVVYYAEYFHIFERARGEYIRRSGLGYAEVEKRGLYLPVAEAAARYRRPLRYDDLIQVRTRIVQWRKASLLFEYEVYNQDRSVRMADGSTLHACVDKSGRPVPVPAWLKNLFVAPENAAAG